MIVKHNSKSINIFICNSFISRLKGLMFKKNISYGLCFPKCNSIHTFFMKENIDIIMTDINYNILYIYKNFPKSKIILPKKKVYYTFEFPKNYFDFNLNEKIKVQF